MQSRVHTFLPLVSLSVFWQPVCCPCESRSPLYYLRLGAASSRKSIRSGLTRYNKISKYSVLSRCEKVFDSVSRVQSSVYPATRLEVGH